MNILQVKYAKFFSYFKLGLHSFGPLRIQDLRNQNLRKNFFEKYYTALQLYIVRLF